MNQNDVYSLERALGKRGFKLDDARPHQCPSCEERAVFKYVHLNPRIGGRDIEWCKACGKARSWRRHGGDEERQEEPAFDLAKFLA
jgi:hypothetical protein